MSKPLVIYHGACRDGFGAAWCVWRRYPNAEFFEGFYGQDPPDCASRDVIMIDFSYRPDVLRTIADQAKSLLVLDHHVTAETALKDFKAPNTEIHFDMNRSGAGMAWDHYYPGRERPWIIDYVEDRDLWRHALPNGPAVNAYISTLRYEFEAWYKASRMDLEEVARLGEVVEDKIRIYVIECAKNARRCDFEGYNVPVVNAPQVDISELVGFLAAGEDLAVGWWQRGDGMFCYSLRSRGGADVSEIAKKYGGGGHKAAAGFQLQKLIF